MRPKTTRVPAGAVYKIFVYPATYLEKSRLPMLQPYAKALWIPIPSFDTSRSLAGLACDARKLDFSDLIFCRHRSMQSFHLSKKRVISQTNESESRV